MVLRNSFCVYDIVQLSKLHQQGLQNSANLAEIILQCVQAQKSFELKSLNKLKFGLSKKS
ncbi:hypothetical protein BpHYR1_039943 [Brachionus plicatilis]|uniref:Uncharacterized protein n=1 Tax=Brachionus plicatilis TaxID=10195 RepID=A0A3M7PME5_BRAPC|nr:hypothetical protein BpHYR1_039943 [Brachionus plicatilis]